MGDGGVETRRAVVKGEKTEKASAIAQVLARVRALEARKAPIVWIPPDESSHVEGHGYRVAVVTAGEAGYQLTGTWPYGGRAGEQMPWFWGPTLEDAARIAEEQNQRIGVSPEEAALVVLRSMSLGVL
jgi:hypothetical protein